jgi:hypothetical protein
MPQTSSASNLIEAPFVGAAVKNLNAFQTHTSGGFVGHPYTCANRGDGQHGEEGGDTGVLIATAEGWVCPHCDYTQFSAHPMMAQDAKPLGHRMFGQPSPAQLRQRIDDHINDYKGLLVRKPGARGVKMMIASLEARLADLDADA